MKQMDTGNLMSSIREMVKAEVMVTLLAENLSPGTDRDREFWGEQYSRHETVVRTELERLGRIASSYKEPPRFK